MGEIILAGIQSAIVLAIALLLHRRLQELTKQVNELRAEIARYERIRERDKMQQLIDAPPNGNGVKAPSPKAAHRKPHLTVINGGAIGAVLAALGARVRETWQQHHAVTIGTVVPVTAVAATVLYFTIGQDPADQEEPAAPAPAAPAWPTPSGPGSPEPTLSVSGPESPEAALTPEPTAMPTTMLPVPPVGSPSQSAASTSPAPSADAQPSPGQVPKESPDSGNGDDSDHGRGDDDGDEDDDDKLDAAPLECVDIDVDQLLDLPACLVDGQ